LIEASSNAASALRRIDQWLKVRTGGTGLMPAEQQVLEALEQAIAQEQSKTIRNCITCKYSHEPANSAVCTDCKHAYTSADHWEPKP